MKKVRLYGTKIDLKESFNAIPIDLSLQFELKECIEVSATRSENTAHIVEFDAEDLLAIKFDDHTEWIGHPEDIQAIYDKQTLQKRSSGEEYYVFDTQISSNNTSRGGITQAIIKVFSVFKVKKNVARITMQKLGEKYDKKVQPFPGLYGIDNSFKRVESNIASIQKPILLLLHGTLSSSIDAFSNLNDSDTWQKIQKKYGNNILAFDHYTLSKSPIENALNFLENCPENCTLDIISHSRGGLIADILAKCDYKNHEHQNLGFSENELKIFQKEDKASYNLMLAINRLALKKRIYVNKVVRIAAPSSGTTILSRRTDHFFNLLLNTFSLAFGIQHPLYVVIKSFLLELVHQKNDPLVLPGLNSMVPDSLFQKMLNASDTVVESELYTIAGDAEVGGISFNSLKVILANLFYQEANDLVVDTSRMVHGVKRIHGYYSYLSQNSDTNHFNYFKNKNTCDAIVEALNPEKGITLYNQQVYAKGQRGVLLDMLSLEGVNFKPEQITKDVVILIPGIMGSTLEVDGEDQWIQMRAISKGAIVDKLNYSSKNVAASGVVKKFYSKFGGYLSESYDVFTLAFDWRKSVVIAAIQLKELLKEVLAQNVNVHIVAHSMGGLVARQCMMDHEAIWSKFKSSKDNKFVMLGTPWLGSYLIMEVLTGHSKRVKQLANIDFNHNKKELLKIFWKFSGVFELLPIEKQTDRFFENTAFWDYIKKEANLEVMPPLNLNKRSLNDFKKYKDKVIKFLDKIDADDSFFDNTYYICGKADKTVFDYTFKNRFLSRHKKLVYKATSYGDGSVTWETGIPKQLRNSSRLYYARTTHGELANEPYIFEGVTDILEQGKTNKLSTQAPRSRTGEIISEVHDYAAPLTAPDDVVAALYGITKTEEVKTEKIHVQVINADLQESSYPVMVGHFFMDLILSAEKALDTYLNNRLSQRLGIGYYPGKIGESEVFFNLNTQPKGAIICGLGTTEGLTTFLLSKTVKLAVLKYAMFMRDNYTLPSAKKFASGISFILIGIGYGKLPIEDSLTGILLGVSEANKYIEETGEGLQRIKNIEIINYYESIASQAYFSLSRMRDNDNRIAIELDKGVIVRAGAKKKQLFADNAYTWWYGLHITSLLENRGFKYYASKGLARVEQEFIGINFSDIAQLLKIQSHTASWDVRLSKALFEMLIPNDFKNVFRNQGNLIVKLDHKSAEIPWELLHDSGIGNTPVSVSSTFIRQLVTKNAEYYSRVALNNNEIFIVGDPIYNQANLPPLPAAKVEAEWVRDQFNIHGYHTTPLIHKNASAIMMELYNKQYKVMHFAGHGVYDPENGQIGIAIGNGICIDPQKIKQIGYVPQFVFINCCYSGVINEEDDKYSRDRYKLAANIGTQLIEMGVKAIIISGWAVDDLAAKTFSETFYENMFLGYDFGKSIKKARLKCFQMYPHTNTWGAYQCYGNQFYKFNSRKKSKKDDLEYVVASQVHTDMNNLLTAIRDRKKNPSKTLEKLKKYLDKADRANLKDAIVLEKEALIYNELNKPKIAYQKFKELFKYANGNFSIEALEQYCVIKTQQFKLETLGEDLKEIEYLALIGQNPSRLNIIGNAYKFASLVVSEKQEKMAYLEKSFVCYDKCYVTSNNHIDINYLDAISNMIFIAYILGQEKNKNLWTYLKSSASFSNEKNIRKKMNTILVDLQGINKVNIDIAVRIGITEASYALQLLENDFVPDTSINVISRFKDTFKQLYSPRFIQEELLQIDYILSYVKQKDLIAQLLQIKEEVKKLKNK